MIVEDLEQVPEEWRDKFEETEIDGKKVYQDKDHAKIARVYYQEKESKQKVSELLKNKDTELSEYKSTEQQRIEAATQAALEKARKDGNSEEVTRIMEEKKQDEISRAVAQAKLDAEKEFTVRLAKKQAESDLVSIVSRLKPVDDFAAKNLHVLLSTRQSVDDDGNIIYLNDDGQASSLDTDGFYNDVIQSGAYKHLIKPDIVVTGGKNLSGSKGGQAPANKKFNEYNGAELAQINKENPALYQKLKNDYYQSEA